MPNEEKEANDVALERLLELALLLTVPAFGWFIYKEQWFLVTLFATMSVVILVGRIIAEP